MTISPLKLGLMHWPDVENDLNIKLNVFKYLAVWLLLSNYTIGFSTTEPCYKLSISAKLGKLYSTNRNPFLQKEM